MARSSPRAAEGREGLTHQSDELARQRQELPWAPIDKGYRFETDEGSASLADPFRGPFTALYPLGWTGSFFKVPRSQAFSKLRDFESRKS